MSRTIAISPDTLGTISMVILDQIQHDHRKRIRRAAFNDLVKLIKLSKLVPADSIFRNLGLGCTSLGDKVIMGTYYSKSRDEEELKELDSE